MTSRKTALALIVVGLLSATVPAFAAGSGTSGQSGGSTSNGSTSSSGTTSGTTTSGNATNGVTANPPAAGSGNGSNGSVGDNPNATATDDLCFRRDTSGHETKIVCPDMPSQSSTPAGASNATP